MARKPTVDVDKVLQMLREGQSTQAVADFFGVSRQAIDLHRRKFILSGQVVERRAPRTVSRPDPGQAGVKDRTPVSLTQPVEVGTQGGQAGSTPKSGERGSQNYQAVPRAESAGTGTRRSEVVSLDRMIELIIEAFDSLKQVPKLESELEQYKRDYSKAVEKIEQLEKMLGKRTEQEARWQLVVPPGGGKPGS